MGATADVASQSPSPVAVGTLSELHAQRVQLNLKEESVFQKYVLEECIAQVEAQRAADSTGSFERPWALCSPCPFLVFGALSQRGFVTLA